MSNDKTNQWRMLVSQPEMQAFAYGHVGF